MPLVVPFVCRPRTSIGRLGIADMENNGTEELEICIDAEMLQIRFRFFTRSSWHAISWVLYNGLRTKEQIAHTLHRGNGGLRTKRYISIVARITFQQHASSTPSTIADVLVLPGGVIVETRCRTG
jgi:hypothetical protein